MKTPEIFIFIIIAALFICSCQSTPLVSPSVVPTHKAFMHTLENDMKPILSTAIYSDCVLCINALSQTYIPDNCTFIDNLSVCKYGSNEFFCDKFIDFHIFTGIKDTFYFISLMPYAYASSKYAIEGSTHYVQKDTCSVWYEYSDEYISKINLFLHNNEITLKNKNNAKNLLTSLFGNGFPPSNLAPSYCNYTLVESVAVLHFFHQQLLKHRIGQDCKEREIFQQMLNFSSYFTDPDVFIFYDVVHNTIELFLMDFQNNSIKSRISVLASENRRFWL